MKCVIPGRFVKLFGRSIHCLSKIGDELYLEATADGLALRTVNSSRSAYGCFLFNRSFFHEFTERLTDGNSTDQLEEIGRFKISMKSCLGVFKSLNTIEKTVDTCKLEYDHKATRIVFKLFCRHGITKTHNLTFQESESVQAVFSKDLCPNLIVAQAKLLLDTAANFQNSCEEVTLGCSAENLKFENYREDEPDPSKVVHTEMMLDPEEFDNYQIGVDAEITFCLKESRAVLSFGEFVNQPVKIQFSSPGKPIVFSVDGDSLYTADFVLATLMDQSGLTQASQDQHQQTVQQTETTTRRAKASKATATRKKTKIPDAIETNGNEDMGAGDQSTEHRQVEQRSFSTPIFYDQNLDQTVEQADVNPENMALKENSADEFLSDSCPYKELLVRTRVPSTTTRDQRLDSEDIGLSRQSTTKDISRDVDMPCLGESLPQNDDDVLSGTPPSKRFKSIFFGTTAGLEEMKEKRKLRETILAADTDDEG